MLILIDIVYENRALKFYRYSRNADCVSFRVKDTDSGKVYSNLSADDVLNFNENVLGVVKTDNDILFIFVDIVTWMLLDYMNEIKTVEVDEDLELIEESTIHKYELKKYRSKDGVVYSIKLPNTVKRLDRYGIFWTVDDGIIWTLSYFYQILYEIDCDNCIALYFVDDCNKVIRLEVNKNIIRLMTKVSVMAGRLHW